MIAVGTAAKESVVTWITVTGRHLSRRRPGRPQRPSRPTGVLGPRTKAIGVLHPGGAAAGGSTAIVADFKEKLGLIEGWADDDPTWLPADPGATRLPASAYQYKSDPIPFRDLPFGTCWRLGSGATSSNRKDDQRVDPALLRRRPLQRPGRRRQLLLGRRRHRTTATPTSRPTCPTSRRAPTPPTTIAGRRRRWPSCCRRGSRPGVARLRRARRARPTRRSAGDRSTAAGYGGVSLLVLADQEIQRRPVHGRGR